MATKGATVTTLVDIAKRTDPSGKIAKVVELLSQKNEMLDDMDWKQGNLPTGHQVTMRNGLPAIYWRLINQAIPTSKSTTVQATDVCGMAEAWSEVDVAAMELNGNSAEYRFSEAKAFIEAMSQEIAQTLIYGNAGLAPEEFTGFAPRFSALSTSVAASAKNVISAGGSGSDNTSIWLVGWGDDSVSGIVPAGSTAGLQHQDLGKQVVTGTTGIGGNKMLAWTEQYVFKAGLSVRDWRYVVRICNIDVSDLVAGTGSNPQITKLMIRALHRLPSLTSCKPVFYMTRTVFEHLDIQRLSSVGSGGGLTYDNVDGRAIYRFRGIPVRIMDQILETEATIS